MSDEDRPGSDGADLLRDMTKWAGAIGQTQRMLIEQGSDLALKMADQAVAAMSAGGSASLPGAAWEQGFALWRETLAGAQAMAPPPTALHEPLLRLLAQTYAGFAEQLIARTDAIEGLEPSQKEQLRFVARAAVDAANPANFAVTNPEVLARTIETRGQNLVTGMSRMLEDAAAGQLRHVAKDAFEIGRNVATTPGKVIYETRLFQLIHYTPATEVVQEVPIVIFPPWINRFYILDLSPQKSFVRWAVSQGFSVFMVSWKSADASIADVTMDDYVLHGEWEAVEVVRRLLDVRRVHVVGYCVAGTALAMLLAWATQTEHADAIASATFFTAQVDFSDPGDLRHFIGDPQLTLLGQLGAGGTVDGRYLAAAFNLLRGRDLIWNYVVNHYLLAEDYKSFDLLHWNSDVTDLPAGWHRRYLADLYRDNLLVQPGALSVDGVPIDLSLVQTPAYVQAGSEDHIAPPESVWKMTHHFAGPLRFVLAGSGHIAGVVNPPAANKYGYRTNDARVATLGEFIAGATETEGSWWPDWAEWLRAHGCEEVPATGARRPGEGGLAAIEDAPGRYVRTR